MYACMQSLLCVLNTLCVCNPHRVCIILPVCAIHSEFAYMCLCVYKLHMFGYLCICFYVCVMVCVSVCAAAHWTLATRTLLLFTPASGRKNKVAFILNTCPNRWGLFGIVGFCKTHIVRQCIYYNSSKFTKKQILSPSWKWGGRHRPHRALGGLSGGGSLSSPLILPLSPPNYAKPPRE